MPLNKKRVILDNKPSSDVWLFLFVLIVVVAGVAQAIYRVDNPQIPQVRVTIQGE